jgi:hypothetical protein
MIVDLFEKAPDVYRRARSHVETIVDRFSAAFARVSEVGREAQQIRMRRIDREVIKKMLPGDYRPGDTICVLGIPVMVDDNVPPYRASLCDENGVELYSVWLN